MVDNGESGEASSFCLKGNDDIGESDITGDGEQKYGLSGSLVDSGSLIWSGGTIDNVVGIDGEKSIILDTRFVGLIIFGDDSESF